MNRPTGDCDSNLPRCDSPSTTLTAYDRHTVLHIEDDPVWAKEVGKGIRRWRDFQLVDTVATGALGIARCCELFPEIVVLDLRLPDLDGLEVMKTLHALANPPRIVLLSVRNDDVVLRHTKEPCVAGMLFKSADFERELRTALTAVTNGGRYLAPAVQAEARRFRSAPNAYDKLLTRREIEVVELIAGGCAGYEIAAVLAISEETVHTHTQHIMKKVEVHSAAKLVVWARGKGFG